MPAAAATLLLATVTATAASVGTVRLSLGECVNGRDLVHDLVAIELGFERLVEGTADRVVEVECRSPVLVVRLVPNPEGLLDRNVLVADATQAHGPRLLALNIVELVQEDDARAPEPIVQAPPAEVLPAAVVLDRPMRARIGAAAAVRLSSGASSPALGARASFALDAAENSWPWSFVFDLGYEQNKANSSLGSARTSAFFAGVGGGARIALVDSLSLYGLALLRGGWAFVDAHSADEAAITGRDGDGPWWGPAFGLRLRYGAALGVTLGVEAGHTVQGVYGQLPEGTVGVRGPWLAADLTIDWSLGGEP